MKQPCLNATVMQKSLSKWMISIVMDGCMLFWIKAPQWCAWPKKTKKHSLVCWQGLLLWIMTFVTYCELRRRPLFQTLPKAGSHWVDVSTLWLKVAPTRQAGSLCFCRLRTANVRNTRICHSFFNTINGRLNNNNNTHTKKTSFVTVHGNILPIISFHMACKFV